MNKQVSAQAADRPYVSTGHLPAPDLVETLVAEAHDKFKSNSDGENSQVYPALAKVPADLFGICVVETNGIIHAAGDTDHEFSIMSVEALPVCVDLPIAWCRGRAQKTWRKRDRLCIQFRRWNRTHV